MKQKGRREGLKSLIGLDFYSRERSYQRGVRPCGFFQYDDQMDFVNYCFV